MFSFSIKNLNFLKKRMQYYRYCSYIFILAFTKSCFRHRKTTLETLASDWVAFLCLLFYRSTPCGRLFLFYSQYNTSCSRTQVLKSKYCRTNFRQRLEYSPDVGKFPNKLGKTDKALFISGKGRVL